MSSRDVDQDPYEFLIAQRTALVRTVRGWLPRQATSDVDDVVQMAYVKALRSIEAVRTRRTSALRAWLFRIARNVVIDGSRRSGREPVTAIDDPEAVASEAALPSRVAEGDARYDRDATVRDLEQLRRDERMALVLHDLQTVSWETSTFVLGRPSQKAARNLHLRGRARMDRHAFDLSVDARQSFA